MAGRITVLGNGMALSCLICVVARPFQTDQLGFISAVGYWLLINGIAVIIMFGILRGFGAMLGGKFVLTALLGSAVFHCYSHRR